MPDESDPSDFQSDYDGAWKDGFQGRLREFAEVYFPAVAGEIDWSVAPEWQDRELEQILAKAGRRNRSVDLLVKLRLRDGSVRTFLLHVEVQSGKAEEFAFRIHLYNAGIMFAFGMRVVTLAVLADLNRNWRPCEDRWEVGDFKSVLTFPVCKLIERLETDWRDRHSLPVELARAQIAGLRTAGDPTGRFRAKMELMKSVYDLGYTADDVRAFYGLLDRMMLLRDDLQLQFRQEVIEFEESRTMPYVTSIERLAKAEGREEGREEGRKEAALKVASRLLARFFGDAPEAIQIRLAGLSGDDLEQLAEAILDMGSYDDVTLWLNER